MPNYCSNSVTIDVIGDDVSFLLDEKGNLSFEKILPTPKELLDTIPGCYTAGSPEDIEHKKQTEKNISTYGYSDWYQWRIAHWGTKWDCYDLYMSIDDTFNGITRVQVSFDTAWCPPIGIYEYLIHDKRIKSLEAYYWEPGCAFYGIYLTEDQENVMNDSYDINGFWSEYLDAYVFSSCPDDSDVFEKASGEIWYTLSDAIEKYKICQYDTTEIYEHFNIDESEDDPSRIQEEDFHKHH